MTFKDELVDIVDENDNIIGTINWKDEEYGKYYLRSASVFLKNSNNEILLQLRSKTSPKYPLHWDLSGAGHVDSGESYENCAKRELFEEVGITIENVKLLGKHYFTLDHGRKRITCCYLSSIESYKTDIDIVEVAEAKWFSIQEIKDMFENKEKFHPECEFLLKKYLLK